MLKNVQLSLEIHVFVIIESSMAKKSSEKVENLDAKEIAERKSSASSVSNTYVKLN